MSKYERQNRYEYFWKRTHRKARRFKNHRHDRSWKQPLRSLFTSGLDTH